jgi:hypothetical protein
LAAEFGLEPDAKLDTNQTLQLLCDHLSANQVPGLVVDEVQRDLSFADLLVW